jgi:hypothetical protein
MISGPSVAVAAQGLLLRIRDEWATIDEQFNTLEGFHCDNWSIRGLLVESVTFHAYVQLFS